MYDTLEKYVKNYGQFLPRSWVSEFEIRIEGKKEWWRDFFKNSIFLYF